MKKRNFNMLENFEVPESWIENAINAKPAPQKKPFYLNPRYTRFIGIAASLVLAAGMPMSTLLANNNSSLISPAFAKINSHLLSENIKNPADTTDDDIIFTNPPETKNGVQATVPSETKNSVQATVPSEIKNRVHATEPPEITNEPSEQQIGTAHTGTQESGNQTSNNDRPERREQSNQTQQSNTRETPKPTVKPQTPTPPTEKPKDSEKEQPATSKEEPEPTSQVNEFYIAKEWNLEISFQSGSGDSSDNKSDNEPTASININNSIPYSGEVLFKENIGISISKRVMNVLKNNSCGKIVCSIKNDSDNINGDLSFIFNTPIDYLEANLFEKKIYIPCGNYQFDFSFFKYNLVSGYQQIDGIKYTLETPDTLDNKKDNKKIIIIK